MIKETHARGLAVRVSGEFQKDTASLAAPIRSDGLIFGCVSLIWIRSDMSTRKVLEDFAEPLLETAEKISLALPR